MEVQQMGYPVLNSSDKMLETRGGMADVVRLNYCLRTANRVLWHIGSVKAGDPKSLYEAISGIDWENYLSIDGYFSVDAYVRNRHVKDTRYANLTVKDAIADRMNSRFGKRPDSGPDKSKSVVFIHWVENACELYFDTSGETLARHGYRINPWKAPLQESLAAALLMASQWQLSDYFVNPMCGSGTLAIEAALMLAGIYPGAFRKNYGYMHIHGFDYSELDDLRAKHEIRGLKKFGTRIVATDNNIRALNAARKNAAQAGVSDLIRFDHADFSETFIPTGRGVVMLNPEYGERLGTIDQLEEVYGKIGDFFKKRCAGYTGYVFTGNLPLAKKIGLRTKSRSIFYNGKIECRLLEYELYQGRRESHA